MLSQRKNVQILLEGKLVLGREFLGPVEQNMYSVGIVYTILSRRVRREKPQEVVYKETLQNSHSLRPSVRYGDSTTKPWAGTI